MIYRFVLDEIKTKKGKLSREERMDIIEYVGGFETEADSLKKAAKTFAAMINGKLSRESAEDNIFVTLPDYGNIQLSVKLLAKCD